MHAFNNSQNFVVNNPQFIDQSVNYHGSSGIDTLHDLSIHEAAYDSSARQYAACCFPGTREQYIDDIMRWAASPLTEHNSPPVYWMRGPAGVGKSAIAQTCAERLKTIGLLGASFFFSINGCDDHTRFFPSIAYQLCVESRNYRDILDQKLNADKSLVRKTMKAQFNGLLAEPLRELEVVGKGLGRRIVIVDGLDECKDKDAQREIVDLVAMSLKAGTVSLCWVFFSRPEPHIHSIFSSASVSALCKMAILPISREVDGEIELYLRTGLENILRRRHISLSYAWPLESHVKMLVSAAAGLFIYPATIIRFMEKPGHTPEELLSIVLGFHDLTSDNSQTFDRSNQPFAELDTFYAMILRRIPENMLPSVQLLLALAIMTPFESCIWGIAGLSNMLGFSEAKLRLLCSELHSVLYFQGHHGPSKLLEPEYSRCTDITQTCKATDLTTMTWLRQNVSKLGGVLTFYHKSFYDFLRDPARSKNFCVSTPVIMNNLFNLRLHIHSNYAQTYTVKGQDLVLAPSRPSSSEILSWPHNTELFDSYIKALTFNNTGFVLLHLFFPYESLSPALVRQLADLDFRKHLLSQAYIFPDGRISRSNNLGLPSLTKFVRGSSTILCCIPPHDFHDFDVERFYKGIRRLEEYKVIRRMRFPKFMKWNVRRGGKSRGKTYSGLYKRGYDDKKTFWYWEFNQELRHYREFETAGIVEGGMIFREENFEAWGCSR